jgi:hypothetical protein
MRIEHYQSQQHITIYQHIHEILVIVKPNAIINKRTMMIHLQHTTLTNRTMMSPIRFIRFTQLTISRFTLHPSLTLKLHTIQYQ